MKSKRLILCIVYLFALAQSITANDELRERFLNLRSRSNSLRGALKTDEGVDELAAPVVLQPESTVSSTTTFEIQTTPASLRRKLSSGRKPNLRLGVRTSSEISQAQEAALEDVLPKSVTMETMNTPSDLQENMNVDTKSRVRGSFGTHRFRQSSSRPSTNQVVNDNNEKFEPEPKIVELPPSAVPVVRRPHIPRRLEKEIESAILTPDETLPIVLKPVDNVEMKKDIALQHSSNVESNKEDKNSELSQDTSKLNSPLSKFESSEPVITMPFSFKHESRPNPIRGSFKSSESKKPFSEKKPDFKMTEENIFQNKTSKANPIKNFYEEQRFPGIDGENETLMTSETKTRSKIEIKEVNGTLYEYEYIYYYDDEAPLYDYDSPAIADENSLTDAVNQIDELTTTPTSTPKPKPTTTTTATKIQSTTTTTTTSSPPPARIRQRPTAGRGSSRASQTKETQETIAHKESLSNPPDVQQNELGTDSRQRGRATSSRQPTRSRGNSRAIVQDSAPAENTVQDVKFEELNLPAHTRFPPRATPPTHELEKPQESLKKGLDEHLNIPLIHGTSRDQHQLKSNSNFDPELVTESYLEGDYIDELTTIDSIAKTDASVANLYALSKVVNADFEDSTTGVPYLELNTPSPTDYESLYDYELTLSELEELDFITTADYDLTTEKITTPSPTTTTTTPTTTITTTTTTTTEAPLQGRGRPGGARTRGSAISRPKGLTRGQPEPKVEIQSVAEEAQPKIESIPAAPIRPGGRLTRPDIKTRTNLKPRGRSSTVVDGNNKKETIEEVVQAPTVDAKPKPTPPRRPVSNGLTRPRPGLGSRFKPKTQTEEPALEITATESANQDTPIEEAQEVSKPAAITPRTRRPPPAPRGRPVSPPKSGIQNRFNRGRPQTSKSEVAELEPQEVNDNATVEEPVQTSNIEEAKDEKVVVAEVAQTSKPPRKAEGGKHRFNLPNKFTRTRPTKGRPGEKDLTESQTTAADETAAADTDSDKTAVETSTSSKLAETSETTAPVNRRGTQKPRENRFKNPNARTRTRGRGILKGDLEVESANDQEPQVIPAEAGSENEATEQKLEGTTEVAGPTHRPRARSRLIPNERKEKNESKSGLSSLFRKSGLLKQKEETKESVVTDAQAETPAEAVRNPFDALAELSAAETDSPQQESSAAKVTLSEAADAAESEIPAEETTDDTPVSAGAEKLSRRQVLASRRSQFLG